MVEPGAHVGFIMDNLIAERKAQPMLVVMEQGYATKPGDAARRRAPGEAGGRAGLQPHVPGI